MTKLCSLNELRDFQKPHVEAHAKRIMVIIKDKMMKAAENPDADLSKIEMLVTETTLSETVRQTLMRLLEDQNWMVYLCENVVEEGRPGAFKLGIEWNSFNFGDRG